MGNLYTYGIHKSLTPVELYCFVAINETCEQLGIADAEAVILILAGFPVLPTRQKPAGATKGTSVASVMSRSIFRYELKRKLLPTVTLNSIKRLKVILTHRLDVFVGRSIPGLGWILLAKDVTEIGYNTTIKYNRLVKPEDRMF